MNVPNNRLAKRGIPQCGALKEGEKIDPSGFRLHQWHKTDPRDVVTHSDRENDRWMDELEDTAFVRNYVASH